MKGGGGEERRKIRMKEVNSKFRHVFICLRRPPLRGYWLGWSTNSVGSESGQIQSVKLLQNMHGLQQDSTPPHTLTHSLFVYTVL